MNKKQLIDAGVPEEAVNAVLALYGQSVTALNTNVTTLTTQNQQLTDQLANATEAVKGFKGKKPEEIDALIEQHKTAAATAKAEGEAAVKALKQDHALDRKLTAAKARNPKAVKALLNTGKLKYDDVKDDFDGLDDQLKTLLKSDPYQFGEVEASKDETENEDKSPEIVTGSQTTPKGSLADRLLNKALQGAGLEIPTAGAATK